MRRRLLPWKRSPLPNGWNNWESAYWKWRVGPSCWLELAFDREIMQTIETEVVPVDANEPDAEAIARAAEILRGGGLVAFPTETVYGLGANALDAEAVARIFVAKGRPARNPIIVHVATIDEAKRLVTTWPTFAQALTKRFWPGPLTLVLPKAANVPD